ncbi:MAG: cytochrome d ubiquinol oxidase subunit II [Oligoflexus sp.]
MIDVLLFFIAAAILLYVLFGGADYGAGITELLPIPNPFRDKQKHVINEAMGPVWESNHIWLILLVVILFVGFPPIFLTIMTSLHFPMLALLFGIVLRGCAFTFRHYDAINDEKSQRIYTLTFGLSSLWTSIWLGILLASLNRGLIDPESDHFYTAYIAPWIGIYPLTMGLFVAFIFAFLASIYLIGETDDVSLKKIFVRRAYAFNILIVIFGGLVFLSSYLEQGSLATQFFSHPLAVTAMLAATLCFVLLWFVIKKRKAIWVRIVAAAQMSLIIAGWFLTYAPHALLTKQGAINFYEAAAPRSTQVQLVIALVVGSLFIFPALIFLLKVFQSKQMRL